MNTNSRRERKNNFNYVENRILPHAVRGCPEVAGMMGISVGRVQQLEKSALRKLSEALLSYGEL